MEKKIVAIDNGHGGDDPGSVNKNLDLNEKDVVHDIGYNMVKPILEHWGYSVFMVRDKDVFVELRDRVELIDRSGADISISIHNNAFHDPSAHGSEVYHYPGSTGEYLAKKVQENFVEKLGVADRGIKPTKSLALVEGPDAPAILCEPSFISNPEEGKNLSSKWYRFLIAYSICDGVREYFEKY